jgi:hypothetical protein
LHRGRKETPATANRDVAQFLLIGVQQILASLAFVADDALLAALETGQSADAAAAQHRPGGRGGHAGLGGQPDRPQRLRSRSDTIRSVVT